MQDALDTLANSKSAKYITLRDEFGETTDEFDAGYEYELSKATRRSAITGSIKVWTEEELLYAFSSGLFKATASTTLVNEHANITAASTSPSSRRR